MTKRKMETSSGIGSIGGSSRGLSNGKEEIEKEVEARVKAIKKINQAMKIGKKKGE